MKKLDLTAENYDDIPLHCEVEVENLRIPIQCESHDGSTLEVTFKPPFKYLGAGRDKVVISGLVNGLDAVVGNSEPVAAAIGIARKHFNAVGQLSGSLRGYRRLRTHVPTAPTYPWYLGSLDKQFVVMPDLTENDTIVTAQNDRIPIPGKIEALEAMFNGIQQELCRFVDGLPFGLYVTYDTYFVLLKENSHRLFLGDFDNLSITHTSIDVATQNRRQVERWVEYVDAYLPNRHITYDFRCWVHQHELSPSKK